MRRTINSLRERPQDERVAIAGSIALGVVGILLIGWVAVFLHGIGGSEPVQAVTPPAPTEGRSVIAPPSNTSLQWEATAATGTDGTMAPATYQSASESTDQSASSSITP